jgi:hypothetical protein
MPWESMLRFMRWVAASEEWREMIQKGDYVEILVYRKRRFDIGRHS